MLNSIKYQLNLTHNFLISNLPETRTSLSGGSDVDVDCSESNCDVDGLVKFCGPAKWDDIRGPAG